MNYESIVIVAEELKTMLKPLCLKFEIAGSVRRLPNIETGILPPKPNDIDLVCVPDRFKLEQFLSINKYKLNLIMLKNGPSYKQFKYKGNTVDLYITDLNNFGWIYFLRTGSKDWNIRAVQRLKSSGITAKDGKLYDKDNNILTVQEETDVFILLDCPYIEPSKRK